MNQQLQTRQKQQMLEATPCYEGGCACGKVRYRATANPMIVHACHCRLCQRQTGSSNVVNALFEADRITLLSGELTIDLLPTPSGNGQLVWRCNDCKVAVWSAYLINAEGENMLFLRVGTLDEPAMMPPDVHIFTSTRLPWYIIPDDQPAVERFYDVEATWSAESKRRRKALTEKTG